MFLRFRAISTSKLSLRF